jgi:hypothetical protein
VGKTRQPSQGQDVVQSTSMNKKQRRPGHEAPQTANSGHLPAYATQLGLNRQRHGCGENESDIAWIMTGGDQKLDKCSGSMRDLTLVIRRHKSRHFRHARLLRMTVCMHRSCTGQVLVHKQSIHTHKASSVNDVNAALIPGSKNHSPHQSGPPCISPPKRCWMPLSFMR